MKNKKYDFLYKIIVVGDGAVGKSSIISMFLNSIFVQDYSLTIGVDFGVKIISLKDKTNIKLQIWDTAGQEQFKSLIKSYYRGAKGVIVVYDCTNESSLNSIQHWFHEIDTNIALNIPIIVAANKIDMQKEKHFLPEEYVDSLIDKYADNILFMETSAKENRNVNELFTSLSELMHSNNMTTNLNTANNNIESNMSLNLNTEQPNNSCC